MARLRSHLSLTTCLLVVALVLIGTSTLLAQPAANKAAKTMTWNLSQGTVTAPDLATQAPEGMRGTGHVVQAAAQSQGAARVPTGKFNVRYTVQEKGGIYILRGAWDITKEGAAKTAHHTPNSIKGTIYAELPFNPAVTPGTINAKVTVTPMRRHASKEVKAEGTFTGNEKFEGTLTLSRK